MTFPEGFLWGAATSSHQVEGDNRNNDWWRWEQEPGRIRDGSTSGHAAEWWTGRAEEDLARAAELGHNAHRLSLEWSRIEPEPGRFDQVALGRYAGILARVRRLGLRSMVTLNHFTLPVWLADSGGWLAGDIQARFATYAYVCATRLADGVDLWATLNEPSVLAYQGYAARRWPPGAGSFRAYIRALRAQLRAHAAGRRAVHEAVPEAKVGIVLNLPLFDPASARPLDRMAAALQDRFFNGFILSSLQSGRLPLSSERVEGLGGGFDFIGVNYYGRYVVRFDLQAGARLFGRHVQEGSVKTDWTDWGQPWPSGLARQVARVTTLGVPLYVTENGIWDEDDTRRPEYLVGHLRALGEAVRAGADVRGYFHWSLVDNFEWAEGWSTRFGLLALDPRSQRRTERPSARLYERICRANRVPDELLAEPGPAAAE